MNGKDANFIFVKLLKLASLAALNLSWWRMLLYLTLFYATDGLILIVLSVYWQIKELYFSQKKTKNTEKSNKML